MDGPFQSSLFLQLSTVIGPVEKLNDLVKTILSSARWNPFENVGQTLQHRSDESCNLVVHCLDSRDDLFRIFLFDTGSPESCLHTLGAHFPSNFSRSIYLRHIQVLQVPVRICSLDFLLKNDLSDDLIQSFHASVKRSSKTLADALPCLEATGWHSNACLTKLGRRGSITTKFWQTLHERITLGEGPCFPFFPHLIGEENDQQVVHYDERERRACCNTEDNYWRD